MSNFELRDIVKAYSISNTWKEAVQEWEIVDYEDSHGLDNSCICGHPNIRYLFTIQNEHNCNILRPIGSSCVKKFGRKDLTSQVTSIEKMFFLYEAIKNGKRIELSTEFFSRDLLQFLYNDGAFIPSSYNGMNAYNDYKFLAKMFNQRSDLSQGERKKTDAIILNSIKPYLKRKLEKKDEG